jgi:hypothetical protein
MSNLTTTDPAGANRHSWRGHVLPILVLILLTAAVSAPVYYYRILTPTENDYGTHILFTQKMLERQLPPTFILAHPLLELIIGFLYWAGRGLIGLWETAVLVQVLAQVAAALVLYAWIGQPGGSRSGAWRYVRVFFALTLTLVGPVILLAPLDGRFYFGYIGLASYHNPTVHLLRPLALVSFILAVRVFQRPSPGWMVALSAAIVVAAALVKPNYAMTILPALAGLTAWFLFKKRAIDWRLLIWGQVIPALLSIAFATVLIYFVPDADKAGLTIAPFAVELGFSSFLAPKFLLSILFPLGAALLFWHAGRQFRGGGMSGDAGMLLAWAAFSAGVVQLYLLAETGERFFHGNFRWGAQITLFILFAATVRFLFQRAAAAELPSVRRWLLLGLYAAHLAGGLAYYIYAITQPHYG